MQPIDSAGFRYNMKVLWSGEKDYKTQFLLRWLDISLFRLVIYAKHSVELYFY